MQKTYRTHNHESPEYVRNLIDHAKQLSEGLLNNERMMLGIMLTNKCNENCSFCGIDKKMKLEELPIELVFSYIDQAHSAGMRTVGFTGGEALLRYGDLLRSLEHAKSKRLETTLVSNASYATDRASAHKVAKDLAEAGLGTLGLSFDKDHLEYTPLMAYVNAIKEALKSNIAVALKMINRKSTKEENSVMLGKLLRKLPGEMTWTDSIRVKGNLLSYMLAHGIPEGNSRIWIERRSVERFGNARNLEKSEFVLKDVTELPFRCESETILVRSDGKAALCCGIPNVSNELLIVGDARETSLKVLIDRANASIPNLAFKKFCGIWNAIYELRQSNDSHLTYLGSRQYTSECDFCNTVLSDLQATSFLARKFDATYPTQIAKQVKLRNQS